MAGTSSAKTRFALLPGHDAYVCGRRSSARHNFAPEPTHVRRHLECGRAMTSSTRYGWARLPLLVAGFSLATVLAAAAQTPPADDDAEEPAAEAATAPDVNDTDIMKDIDVSKLDWSQLNVDASALNGPAPKGRNAPNNAGATAS